MTAYPRKIKIYGANANGWLRCPAGPQASTPTVKFRTTAVIEIDDFSLTSVPPGGTAVAPLRR